MKIQINIYRLLGKDGQNERALIYILESNKRRNVVVEVKGNIIGHVNVGR